jgi:hypothetical protein
MLPALAYQRTRAHSLGGCAEHRPCSANSGLRLSSAARGDWEQITAIGENQSPDTVSRVSDKAYGTGLKHPPPGVETGALIAQTLLTVLTEH